MNKTTLKELNEALDVPDKNKCYWEEMPWEVAEYYKAAKFTRNLLQAIERGEVAVVECEADGLVAMDMSVRMSGRWIKRGDEKDTERSKRAYEAAIKAAPDVVDGLWD